MDIVTILIWLGIVLVVGVFVRWQWAYIMGFWQDGGRGQFLVMGMPSVIVAVLGLCAIGLAAINSEKLDVHYENLAQRAKEESKRIKEGIIADHNLVNQQNTSLKNLDGVVDEEIREQLKSEYDKERIYLKKLVALDEDNPEHKFNLALLAGKEGNLSRCLNLMQLVSPFEEPGYSKGHLYLARHFLTYPSKNR